MYDIMISGKSHECTSFLKGQTDEKSACFFRGIFQEAKKRFAVKDERSISEEYAKIAHSIIETESEFDYLKDEDLTIIYLVSEHAKIKGKKRILGECEKVRDKYKWAIDADFIITVFEPNCYGMTDEQKKILIRHELKHIGISDRGELFVQPHDVEDFAEIIDKYGIRWAET